MTEIGDYGLIGNLRTAALVSRSGSIDWYCPERFDAPASFAALLGEEQHGRWLIAACEPYESKRRYLDDTLVLETRFRTESGEVSVSDFMPLHCGNYIVRIVRGLSGELPVRLNCAPRFEYGRNYPQVDQLGPRCYQFRNKHEALMLHASIDLHRDSDSARGALNTQFSVKAGSEHFFVLEHRSETTQVEALAIDPFKAERDSCEWWREWAQRCNYDGPWREAVTRSLITIKALSYEPSGGMVAAPTTSLPEYIGGSANWDYRFCWIRDAALALDVLIGCNYFEEAKQWRSWLQQVAETHRGPLRPLYTIDGQLCGEEKVLNWLPGFAGSTPVRIGNAAARQHQIDLRGELMDVFHVARATHLGVQPEIWDIQRRVLEHLSTCWREPDAGFWEVRGEGNHWTLSKVMAWVAFDRSIRDAEHHHLEAPLDEWKQIRDTIREDVLSKGIHPDKGHFVDRYGSDRLDAGLLMIPVVNFLPADDERVVKTVAAIEERLCDNGLVYRYRSDGESWYDKEGAFLLCSFWLVDNYWLAGRHEEARKLFEKLLSLCNDLGLLAEEYDPKAERFLGNFPQTLTHLGLVNSARLLAGERVLRCG